MLERYGVAGFSLDVLRMGLYRGARCLDLDPERDDLEKADRLWPVVQAMCFNLMKHRRDYCLAGACLRPEHAAALATALPGQMRVCFIGYPALDAAAKTALIYAHKGGSNDWLSINAPEAVHAFAVQQVTRNAVLEADCGRLGLPFFDTGGGLRGRSDGGGTQLDRLTFFVCEKLSFDTFSAWRANLIKL